MALPLPAETIAGDERPPVSRTYAWVAFALVVGLMLSDYLSRQVINPVFPLLKAEWSLSDAQLGALASIVALVVGVMTFPISLVADRVGRVKSATAMALVWGAATVACGLAGDFTTMLIARAMVGLGEAGYGSAGGAILTHLFPRRLHATVMGIFLAAALFGSVLGVVLGGAIAQAYGWQAAFIIVGAAGLALAIVFPMVVKEPPASRPADAARLSVGEMIREAFAARTANFTYVASGLMMFVQGAIIAWVPSYLNRYYGMNPADAGLRAGVLVLVAGVGMTIGGIVVDRLSRSRQVNRLRVPALYALFSGALLLAAFLLPPGATQLLLVGLGLAIGAGFAGPSGAIVAEVTNPAIRATAFATLTLANNLIGLAPGPFVTGLVADRAGLDVAMCIVPLAGILAAGFFFLASRSYQARAG
jgi:MFS family permease